MYNIYYHIKNTSQRGGRARKGGREEGKGGRKGLSILDIIHVHYTLHIILNVTYSHVHHAARLDRAVAEKGHYVCVRARACVRACVCACVCVCVCVRVCVCVAWIAP